MIVTNIAHRESLDRIDGWLDFFASFIEMTADQNIAKNHKLKSKGSVKLKWF